MAFTQPSERPRHGLSCSRTLRSLPFVMLIRPSASHTKVVNLGQRQNSHDKLADYLTEIYLVITVPRQQ